MTRLGAFFGLLFALGLLLAWAGLPHRRRLGLAGRVLPYLADAPRPSRLLDIAPRRAGTLTVVLAPVMGHLAAGLDRVMGGSASIRRRLLRAGLAPDVDRFRAEQVMWGLAFTGASLVVATATVVLRGASAVTALMLVLLSGATGVVLADHRPGRRAARREATMLAEFPTIAELLALAISAGEGAVGALDRVCRLSSGALSDELRRCLADARAGANLPSALQGLADRTGLPSLTRFVDGIVVAVERGTPLAEVLRAQAQDVREESRRAVIEEGGRKEIQMMVPVVFLILPVTVLFAVYPGITFFSFTI